MSLNMYEVIRHLAETANGPKVKYTLSLCKINDMKADAPKSMRCFVFLILICHTPAQVKMSKKKSINFLHLSLDRTYLNKPL